MPFVASCFRNLNIFDGSYNRVATHYGSNVWLARTSMASLHPHFIFFTLIRSASYVV